MSGTVINVENLSKRYVIGHQSDARDGLRHAIENAFRNPFEWFRNLQKARQSMTEEFWALEDISFDIKQGEAVGIIGRNGAGKSTLLKILSRITEPSSGRIRMRGRISSLLEVGTGFHPELTGRENIYLNGAILGMTRVEIKRKFDEIVAFAGLERFLDTPVKRYSSGMYVRLAFAVAAHMEPEILIVDEVLAVGDAEFQKKCLNKMDDVGHSGRTVLFVSHNMQAVTRLCARSIWLEKGKVRMDASAHSVANSYISSGAEITSERTWNSGGKAPGTKAARLLAIRVRSEDGSKPEAFDVRESIGVEIHYEVLESGNVFLPHFMLTNDSGIQVFTSVDLDPEWRGKPRSPGRYVSTGWIAGNSLAEGTFSITAVVMTLNPVNVHALVRDALLFRVIDPLSESNTARGDYPHPMPGVVRPALRWTTAYDPA